MKKETQQSDGNTGNHEGGVFASGRKWALGAKKDIETPLCQRTTEDGLKKDLLQTGGAVSKSLKSPTLVAGTKPNGKSRLIGLDFLRFVAASLVLCNHAGDFGNAGAIFQKTHGVVGYVLQKISGLGWVAVDIFFVLSGFLVSGLLFKEAAQTGTVSITRFLIRRGFKIYPSFWVMITVTSVWAWSAGYPVSFPGLWHELLYLQNYLGGICGHTWSLAVEEHFYFLLAGLFFILKRRMRPNQRINFNGIPNLFLTVAVVCLALRFFTWWFCMDATNQNMNWFNRVTHVLVDSLFFGVLLSHYWHNCWHESIKRKIYSLRMLFAIAGFCLLLPSMVEVMDIQWYRIFGFILVYLGAGCVLLSSFSLDYYPCPVFIKWLAWLGKYSYSVYLWHFFVGYHFYPLLEVKLDNVFGWIINALLYFTSSWGFGIVIARAIEFPALRCRDRWFPSLSLA
jgi:peptidoglycan/LPS O-acetylase OafA/YrhL